MEAEEDSSDIDVFETIPHKFLLKSAIRSSRIADIHSNLSYWHMIKTGSTSGRFMDV